MWKFWIDTGGTFTDCIARAPDGAMLRVKTLSSSALRGEVVERIDGCSYRLKLGEAVVDDFYLGYGFSVLGETETALARVISWDCDKGIVTLDTDIGEVSENALCELQSPEEPPVLAARLLTRTRLDESLPPLEMRLATTRGTNALLERKGAKVAFVVTKGFGDLLRIGNQQRPDLFEIGIQKPEPLHEVVFEADERLDAAGEILVGLDEDAVRAFALRAIDDGVEAFAVSLLHAYKNSAHERRVAEILREAGARYVSVSSDLSPFVKILPRAETTVVDAYLAPIMDAYLDAVESAVGLDLGPDRIAGSSSTGAVWTKVQPYNNKFLRIMTSAGGLVSRGQYRPKDSLLSGPAGGVVGSSSSGVSAGFERTIAFDMGGTSTDVSRYDGQLDYRFEQQIGAARVFAPSLRIETVAAGGGSICWFDGSALRVGPESAGANPGPACYGAGGPLTVTDVNLLCGRLDVSKFGIPISVEASRLRIAELQAEILKATGEGIEERSLLDGLLDIANETMAEAIRKVSTSEGYDPAEYALVAFGGAGGLHACAIADALKMDTVLFPADAGLLSAYGLKQARVEQFAGRQVLQDLEDCIKGLDAWIAELTEEALEALSANGVDRLDAELQPVRFELRYRGQESIVVIEGGEIVTLGSRFEVAYRNRFGFLPESLAIELVALRVAARSAGEETVGEAFEEIDLSSGGGKRPCVANGISESSIRDARSLPTGGVVSFVDRDILVSGNCLVGPIVIQDSYSTVFVDTGWKAIVGTAGTLKLEKVAAESVLSARSQVVELELFTNRFLSIVDEMGVLLERVAFSTNVKDRKDFSCALLDREGYLVANAPHIPVHLGALGVCVRTVLETMSLESGDVVVTNHPAFGGSHLPDVTLIAPVYSENGNELLGYVANRAHHAELGGISPGSMPPNARNLGEEGVVISPLKLARGGVVDWGPVKELLIGGAYPSRAVAENVADLSAQLASIRSGVDSLRSLAESESADRVGRFMNLLKERASRSLRAALGRLDFGVVEDASERRPYLEAVEYLDEGVAVKVSVSQKQDGKWLIDFSGSADVQPNNYNATPAITTSAVIYVLRLLAAEKIPLNEGFLDVVDILIPVGMLNPDFDSDPTRCPAVVAGNVEVSQLIVSVLLKAFGLAACSQSTMNNLIFGTNAFGYYETIAGGEGACSARKGASGVHTHMTNTAMTDPEVMELRYPVRVETFSLRKGSGGKGQHCGGDGVIKRIRFLEDVTLSLLTQRRVEHPFGMHGGEAGACGEQALIGDNGVEEVLPGNGTVEMRSGAVVEVRTPGGGGWGGESVEGENGK